MQNHVKLHTKHSGNISCHICSYNMNADKESFKAHVKKHSQVPPKHCVLCSKGDAEDFDLRQHVQTDVSNQYQWNWYGFRDLWTESYLPMNISAQRCEFAVRLLWKNVCLCVSIVQTSTISYRWATRAMSTLSENIQVEAQPQRAFGNACKNYHILVMAHSLTSISKNRGQMMPNGISCLKNVQPKIRPFLSVVGF